MSFTNKPTNIQYWPDNIPYVMFVDENNSGVLEHIQRLNKKGINVKEDEKYFTVTGCILEKEQYQLLKNEFELLKLKYWENGLYYDEERKKHCKVCFHSNEIRRRSKCFREIFVDHNIISEELSEIIKKLNFKIVSVTIDVEKHLKTSSKVNLYGKAMEVLLEKYAVYLKEEKGIITLESRGKKEDYELHDYIKKKILDDKNVLLKEHITDIFFNGKYNVDNTATYAGLELADLCSYPIYKYMKNNYTDKAFLVIEDKIMGFPNHKDNGIIKIQ